MRIVIVGASGNTGTALLRRLGRESGLDIVGIARRPPSCGSGQPYDSVEWHAQDIGAPDAVHNLTLVFSGADVVVHLAWQIQPSHDQRALHRTNVTGSQAVIDAVLSSGVKSLVYASSVGTYAPGPKDRWVGEDWPATGVRASSYGRDKAEVEAMLDRAEARAPELRVVRLRPGLIFQRDAATEVTRFFLGPLAPVRLLRFHRLPLVPTNSRLRMQAVHADDVADAYARAILGDARGAFNLAADPVLTPELVAQHFHGRTLPVPGMLLRVAAALTWRARLQPIDGGWIELALGVPLMSTRRSATELGWRPRVSALDALGELFMGMAQRGHAGSPPLAGRIRPAKGPMPGHGNPY